MAMTAVLSHASVMLAGNGQGATMEAVINFDDDQLGRIGVRAITVTDPAITAQVLQFITQMLPALSADAGIAVVMPGAPVPEE